MGHGNDMTYNSKTDKILIVGPDEYETVWEFTPSTFQNGASRVIKIKEILVIILWIMNQWIISIINYVNLSIQVHFC